MTTMLLQQWREKKRSAQPDYLAPHKHPASEQFYYLMQCLCQRSKTEKHQILFMFQKAPSPHPSGGGLILKEGDVTRFRNSLCVATQVQHWELRILVLLPERTDSLVPAVREFRTPAPYLKSLSPFPDTYTVTSGPPAIFYK
jgi:hypothetical protein